MCLTSFFWLTWHCKYLVFSLIFNRHLLENRGISWDIDLSDFTVHTNNSAFDLQGVSIQIDCREVLIQGTIAQLSADNKAANSILGLQECFFGANRCISRYCYCTSTDIQSKVIVSNAVKFLFFIFCQGHFH